MDILDNFLDILLKPPQPLMGLFFICENKNLNPHYPGLITGAAP